MKAARPVSGMRRRERGATAIEFALMLPVFFLILYAIITYGMIFAAQQNLTLAATEGARAALNYQQVGAAASVQAAQQAALAARAQAACTAATNLTTWLKGSTCSPTQQGNCSYDPTMLCVQITLTYPYSPSSTVVSARRVVSAGTCTLLIVIECTKSSWLDSGATFNAIRRGLSTVGVTVSPTP
jgi:Flp pilus assembly protein TadG